VEGAAGDRGPYSDKDGGNGTEKGEKGMVRLAEGKGLLEG
jgi:hypothetical protein